MAEKARGASVSIIGMVLGCVEIIIAAFIISFATSFNLWVLQITAPTQYYTFPTYMSGLLGATASILLFGGIYVLLHAVKRIVDQGFMAYLSATKKPK